MPQVIRKLFLFFAVSFSAQLGTLPFTLAYFHKLSVISLAANLIVIPLIGFIVSTSIVSLLAGVISIWLAEVIAGTNELAAGFLFEFVR